MKAWLTRQTAKPTSASLYPFAHRSLPWAVVLVVALAVAPDQARVGAQAPAALAPAPTMPSAAEVAAVRDYIRRTWDTLTRTLADVPVAARDPKLPHAPGQPWTIYIDPAGEDLDAVRARVGAALAPEAKDSVEVLPLPDDRRATGGRQGLLYLPHPYVVPGGRFNEMYGWDSYFIVVGLLAEGEVERAKAMVDNHLYQVRHYGMVLNANRTYYLSRSQPPFLARMVRDVFAKTHSRDWVAAALPVLYEYYRFWTIAPHLAGDTTLSRYYDLGEGPAPEVVSDERDAEGRTHYDRVKDYYRTHDVTDYVESRFYDREKNELSARFYKGDRSMRESGFDPSNRFGAFGVDVVSYAPVCLNSLLFQMENDMAELHDAVGGTAEAAVWRARASRRKAAVDRYLWDEAAGLYFDYNTESARRRPYEFATTFYPLWVGLASPEQARRVRDALPKFEAPGGILTSTQRTGNQWDAPFGWAPLQMAAVDGLRRYGFVAEADRVAAEFIGLVTKEFNEHGIIVEKYDVTRRESDVAGSIKFGYDTNVVGFGWTNGVYLHLLDSMGRRGGQ